MPLPINKMNAGIKIIFTEDKEVFRKTVIEELAEYGIICIGEASNGKELLRQLKDKHPDVILLDLEMPVMNGNETMTHLRRDYPDARVLIMSLHYEGELITDYIRRGAKGYVSKDAICGNIELLVEAIKKINTSEIFIQHPELCKSTTFSPRQIEMIPLLCDELTNKQIAERMGILERSVEKQRQKIYSKTGSAAAASFFKYAFKRGLDLLERRRQK
ncbi:MAG: response regulator transcription factor [Bacteroidia bacterium]|nr:response regulator transcription factor [Bacteroidia bacterium]